MARRVTLQQAKTERYDFALHLYLLGMRTYMQELNVWDEQQQSASFAAQWEREEVQIISVDGKNVGWLQIAEPTEIRLQKFFVWPLALDQKYWVTCSRPGDLRGRRLCSESSKTILPDGSMSALGFL